jgi:hypothetical protein
MVERKHLKKKVILSTTLWETIKIITNKEKKKQKKMINSFFSTPKTVQTSKQTT